MNEDQLDFAAERITNELRDITEAFEALREELVEATDRISELEVELTGERGENRDLRTEVDDLSDAIAHLESEAAA